MTDSEGRNWENSTPLSDVAINFLYALISDCKEIVSVFWYNYHGLTAYVREENNTKNNIAPSLLLAAFRSTLKNHDSYFVKALWIEKIE
ncbi:hypothetical protein [Candidatus Coxiella mudrowiae]|uniref:hypothetical protein n=1 Tax=Candidatus Coxiella mudrowiae TaxID=2054173 RepID=UPI0006627F7E|nr:hypothetical protein [Candidatus Coxiella mudrowiae]